MGDVLTGPMLLRSNKRFDVDLEVVVEARVGRTHPDLPVSYGLEAAYEGDDAHLFYGVLGRDLVLSNVTSARAQERPRTLWSKALDELDPPLKPEDWHAFGLTLEPTVVRLLLDGKVLASVPRPRERDGGYVALLVQACTMQVRKVEVTAR